MRDQEENTARPHRGARETLKPLPASIVLVGGDLIVGRTLELLLRSAEFDARYFAGPYLKSPKLLDGVQLLLIAPGLSTECREYVLALVESGALPKKIPVLELFRDGGGGRTEEGHLSLGWPCRLEELKRKINASLLIKATLSEGDENILFSERGAA